MDNSRPGSKFSLGNLLYNLTSPTPAVHKILRNWALFIGGLAATVVAVDKAVAHMIPELYVNVSKGITVACATSFFHSQAQTDNTSADTSNTATDDTTATT